MTVAWRPPAGRWSRRMPPGCAAVERGTHPFRPFDQRDPPLAQLVEAEGEEVARGAEAVGVDMQDGHARAVLVPEGGGDVGPEDQPASSPPRGGHQQAHQGGLAGAERATRGRPPHRPPRAAASRRASCPVACSSGSAISLLGPGSCPAWCRQATRVVGKCLDRRAAGRASPLPVDGSGRSRSRGSPRVRDAVGVTLSGRRDPLPDGALECAPCPGTRMRSGGRPPTESRSQATRQGTGGHHDPAWRHRPTRPGPSTPWPPAPQPPPSRPTAARQPAPPPRASSTAISGPDAAAQAHMLAGARLRLARPSPRSRRGGARRHPQRGAALRPERARRA